MTYGYSYTSSRGEGSYRIRADGVALDFTRHVLRLTATHDAHWNHQPITAEFPLILARLCKTCGEPVSIYARGTLDAFVKATGGGDFVKPWRSDNGWKRLDQAGGFALVADRGHNFEWSHSALSPRCHDTDLRLVMAPAPPAPAKPPPPPPRPKPTKPRGPPAPRPSPPAIPTPASAASADTAAITPTTAATPDITPAAETPRRAPPRVQLGFSW